MPIRPAVVRHPLALAGVVLATAAAVVFVALVLAVFSGLINNPYAGLIVFVAVPAIFVLGLLCIPAGLYLERKRLKAHPGAPADWPVLDFRLAAVRRVTLVVVALTCVNVVLILLAGYGTVHWMESPSFCGQVCHTPMQPQFTAWSAGAHGRVACVDCHIGEGPRAFVHAKLAGVRQLLHVATGTYPRPIPPGAAMPAGAQAATCLGCHQPQRLVGDRIRLFREYADDEENSETRTVMQLFVGAGSASGRAIHWHADPSVRVEYIASLDNAIVYVKATRSNGQVTEYLAEGVNPDVAASTGRRLMDCLDCHNTVGHPMAQSAALAVDRAIAEGQVSRSLPFVRREGVRLIGEAYPDHEQAARAIEDGMRQFYQSTGAAADPESLRRAIAALQSAHQTSSFPSMKVTFGSYPDNRGHTTSDGCIRCHDDLHVAKDGSTISGDCEYCHKEVAMPPVPAP